MMPQQAMKTAQVQQNKPNIPDWVLYLLVIIFLIFLVSGFTGCNPITKATQQVLTNGPAFNKVGVAWAKLNPCVVDSTKTLVHDTTFKTDTTYKLLPPTPVRTGTGGPKGGQINSGDVLQPSIKSTRAGKEGANGLDTVTKTITNTITVHDSVKIVSVDKRILGLYADSINYYKLAFANYKADTIKQVSGLQHTAAMRLWIIIGITTALLIYIFCKPLLALVTGGTSLLTKII